MEEKSVAKDILTLVGAQRLLLGIITSVESGITSPEDAVEELATLREQVAASGIGFHWDYTLEDFQKIRAVSQSACDEDDNRYVPEPSYEESESNY
jgi:hypothetical protein